MGFAIKRPDGSYRAWNRNAPETPLQAGEVYEERDTEPVITTPPPSEATLGQRFDNETMLSAAVLALLDELDARVPGPPVNRTAFRAKVIARLRAG